jgi:hypothetical protein
VYLHYITIIVNRHMELIYRAMIWLTTVVYN